MLFSLALGGTIQDPFFKIEGFQGTKFLSEAFLDEDRAFLYAADKVYVFPLADTDNVRTAFPVPSFSNVRFTTDENYLYVGVGGYDDGSIRIYDKVDYAIVHEIALPGVRLVGVAVDANYVYASDSKTGTVRVFNKRTYNDTGTVSASDAYTIEVVDDQLYVVDRVQKTLRRYSVTFN